MSATLRLLDALKLKHGINSDYGLALYWKVKPQRIGHWRQGAHTLSDEKALEICRELDLDPGPVLIELQAERARKSERFAVADAFENLLRKLGSGAAVMLALFVGVPTPADAYGIISKDIGAMHSAFDSNANYQKYTTVFRFLRRCLSWLATCIIRPLPTASV